MTHVGFRAHVKIASRIVSYRIVLLGLGRREADKNIQQPNLQIYWDILLGYISIFGVLVNVKIHYVYIMIALDMSHSPVKVRDSRTKVVIWRRYEHTRGVHNFISKIFQSLCGKYCRQLNVLTRTVY